MEMTFRELLHLAREQVKELTTLEKPDVRLEQVEKDENQGVWKVIVSYLVENNNKRSNPLTALSPDLPFERVYKKLTFQGTKVTGMFMYDHSA